MTTPAIDLHTHVFTPEAHDLVASLTTQDDPLGFGAGKASSAYNSGQYALLHSKLTDPEQRLRDMDEMGIDMQVLSVAPNQFYYWAEPELGARLARLQNERIAELVAARPDRFVGMATVPMQDASLAVSELDYAVTHLGLKGAEVCTSIQGADLDHEAFRPFLTRLHELDGLLLLHPLGTTMGDRLEAYYLSNVIGNPLDTTIAVSRLILSGVLEELQGLKVATVHGGGYLPFYSSRIDHAYEVRPETSSVLNRPPTEYLAGVFVDTLVFDPLHLRHLIEKMGAGQVVLGTDYPYDMGHYDPIGTLAGVELAAEDIDRIRGGNAAALLGLA